MVGIQGIGGVPEPKPGRPASTRNHDDASAASDTAAGSKDGVAFSGAAQAAANAARVIHSAQNAPDVRADRVEAARAELERGDFKNPEIVAVVAERLSKIL